MPSLHIFTNWREKARREPQIPKAQVSPACGGPSARTRTDGPIGINADLHRFYGYRAQGQKSTRAQGAEGQRDDGGGRRDGRGTKEDGGRTRDDGNRRGGEKREIHGVKPSFCAEGGRIALQSSPLNVLSKSDGRRASSSVAIRG